MTRGCARLPWQLEVEMTLRAGWRRRLINDNKEPATATQLSTVSGPRPQPKRKGVLYTQLNSTRRDSTRLIPSSTASSAVAEADAVNSSFFVLFVLNCSAQVVGGTSSKDHGAAIYNWKREEGTTKLLSTWLTFKVDYECRPTLVEMPADDDDDDAVDGYGDGAGWRQVKCFHYESLSWARELSCRQFFIIGAAFECPRVLFQAL